MYALQGVWPALVTPFAPDDTINVPVLQDLTDYLLDKGVGGFYLCGTTGEGVFMSVAERQLVAETVLAQVDGRVPVIVHVGCMASGDALALARHAQQHGAFGVSSILPPHYRDAESLYAYFAALAKAVPDLPLFPYVFGGTTDALSLLHRLRHISAVSGTKYTGPDMFEFRHLVELGEGREDWWVFSGMDEECLYAAMMGASGNIGSTLNFMPGVYREIHRSFQRGDIAHGQELQLRANRVITVLLETGLQATLKAAVGLLGFDCGSPRLPTLPLRAEQRETLRARLEAVGFFELAEM